MKTFKKTMLAGTVAACALGAASATYANVYAYSHLLVTDFVILQGSTVGDLTDATSTGDQWALSDFDPIVVTNTQSNTADIDGTSDTPPSDAAGVGQDADSVFACVGSCGFAQNDFTQTPENSTGTFTRADGALNGTIIDIDPTTTNSATGETVAEGWLYEDATGSSNATITTDGGFTVSTVITPTISDSVVFQFDGLIDLVVAYDTDPLNPPPAVVTSAEADSNFRISITQGGVSVFEWEPGGSVNGIVGGTEYFDDGDLNAARNVAYPFAPTSITFNDSGFFRAATPVLVAGQSYLISINHNTDIDVRRASQIPEPNVLALLGVGLLGIVGLRRRRLV